MFDSPVKKAVTKAIEQHIESHERAHKTRVAQIKEDFKRDIARAKELLSEKQAISLQQAVEGILKGLV